MSRDGGARELRAAISLVLRRDWNPIGVAGLPADEYDGYVGGVYRLLAEGASAERVAGHLAELERVSMGLEPRDVGALLAVARTLLALTAGGRRRRPPPRRGV